MCYLATVLDPLPPCIASEWGCPFAPATDLQKQTASVEHQDLLQSRNFVCAGMYNFSIFGSAEKLAGCICAQGEEVTARAIEISQKKPFTTALSKLS